MLNELNIPLNASDILYAAIAAFCLTLIIRNFVRIHRIMKQAVRTVAPDKDDLKAVLDRCYTVFPLEMFSFHGQTYRRGMKIKITTLQNKIFEGELIGFNTKNMVCIMTSRLIVAHELQNIREIVLLEEN